MGSAGDAWSDPVRWYDEQHELVGGLKQRLDEVLLACPAGYATVMAVFDWREAAGVAVPAERLYGQAARRMAALRPERALTREEFAAGLAEATAEPALLTEDGSGRYALAEPVHDLLLPALWAGGLGGGELARVTPLEAIAIGKAARYAREPDQVLARRAWRQAAGGDDADAAALARWYLAEAALEDGDAAAAEDAFRRILAEDHFATAPRAMLALAELELDRAPDQARVLLEGAVAAGQREVAAHAARILAALRERQGDEPGTIDALRVAFEQADALSAPSDGLRLAALLKRSGDAAAAERVLRQIIAGDFLLHTGRAVVELSALLADRGDLAGAQRLLTEAIERELLLRPLLQLQLARLHIMLGDQEAAGALVAQARKEPVGLRPEDAAQAGMIEAQLAILREDDEAAARLFTEVLHSADPVTRKTAHLLAVAIGEGMRPGGPWAIPGIEPLMRHLMTEADSPTREWAAYGAGIIAEEDGRTQEARQAFGAAVAGDAPRYGALAALKLATLAADSGEAGRFLEVCAEIFEAGPAAEEAEEGPAKAVVPAGRFLLRQGRPDLIARIHEACMEHIRRCSRQAASIAVELARLHTDVLGDRFAAMPIWELAADCGDCELASMACHNLGVLHARRYSPLSAARAFERAIQLGHPQYAPRAALALGGLASRFYDVDAAIDAYAQALTSEDPRAGAEAALRLACLVEPPDDAEAALHRVIDSPTAPPELIGAAYAHLGRVYAETGNRRLAQRYWRKGRHHPDPAVSAAFAAERKIIGRVMGPRRPT